MSLTAPRVSVVLSTFNRSHTLPRAVKSVLAQTFNDLELVVIDDCSDDDTIEVLARWADDPRMRLLRNSTNRGLPTSLNRGLEASSAEYIARIDDDDFWTDSLKLERQVAFLDDNPGHVIVGTGFVDEWDRRITNPATDESIRKQMMFRCPLCHSSVLFRRSVAIKTGAYDETLPYAEDWEFWMRLGHAGKLANLPEITLVKAREAETLSERFFNQQLLMASRFVSQHGANYPRARQARLYHGFNRTFFALFPPGGRVHEFMRGMFLRWFKLR